MSLKVVLYGRGQSQAAHLQSVEPTQVYALPATDGRDGGNVVRLNQRRKLPPCKRMRNRLEKQR